MKLDNLSLQKFHPVLETTRAFDDSVYILLVDILDGETAVTFFSLKKCSEKVI